MSVKIGKLTINNSFNPSIVACRAGIPPKQKITAKGTIRFLISLTLVHPPFLKDFSLELYNTKMN